MPCPNCKSNAKIAIGKKSYCTNCGEILSAGEPRHVAMARSMTQARPAPMPKPVMAPKPTVRPAAVNIAPTTAPRLMRDLGGPVRAQQPVQRAAHQAASASQFHAKLKPARGGVLDLRANTPKPAAVAATAVHSKRAVAAPSVVRAEPAKQRPVEAKRHTSVAAKAMHSPAKAQLESPKPSHIAARTKQTGRHLEHAGTIQRSGQISRFAAKPVMSPVAKTAAVAPNVLADQPELPRYAAAQHEHLSRLVEVMKTEAPGGHRQATKPSRASFAAAAFAIAIISGYVWLHNYPQLALSTASSKAGFTASLPSFIPASYSLKGSPSYSPGLVTLSFKSPSFSSPIKATQQPTSWDSSSLLDNYVAAKTPDYTTVDGQGLTIYLMDDNKEATWVNHGIWYSLDGVTNVSRDQLLKMAYSF